MPSLQKREVLKRFRRALGRPLRRHPMSLLVGVMSLLSFVFINRMGNLPPSALMRFGFSGKAPILEWPYRSFVSDFLYFNATHLLTVGVAYVALIYWCERSHRLPFVAGFVILTSVFDDLINYLVLVAPLQYLQPPLFRQVIAMKDVGSSLGMSALVGLQICQFNRVREPLFALITLGATLALVFSSPRHHLMVMNLNHVVFLVIGFLVGKLDFEYGRAVNRK